MSSVIAKCPCTRSLLLFSEISPVTPHARCPSLAAVAPSQGLLTALVLPSANTEMMNVFLRHLSETFANYFIVMQVDQAGWHRSQELFIPANIRLIPQPAYSPEVNSVEHVWDEVREKYFANRQFASMDQLEEQLVTGLAVLEADTPRMASLTGFDWISENDARSVSLIAGIETFTM